MKLVGIGELFIPHQHIRDGALDVFDTEPPGEDSRLRRREEGK